MTTVNFGYRRSGRTARAIVWLLESPEERLIVTFDERERNRIMNEISVQFPANDERNNAHYWADAVQGWTGMRNGKPRREILIDNAEAVLAAMLFPHSPLTINFTIGDSTVNVDSIPPNDQYLDPATQTIIEPMALASDEMYPADFED